jgi:hypothetical protein
MCLRDSFQTRVRHPLIIPPVDINEQSASRDKVVQVVSSSQDHTRDAKRTTSKTFFIKSGRSDGSFTAIASPAQDVSPEVVASAISPSGKLTALLRETNSGEKKRFVEIWEGERLEASVSVTKTHAAFYADGESPVLPIIMRRNLLPSKDPLRIISLPRAVFHSRIFSLRDLVGLHCRSECTR